MSEEGLQKTEKVENQPFDEAVEINDSEELDSEDDDEDQHFQNQAKGSQSAPKQPQFQQEQKELPGSYNPADYAGLKVDKDVKELFEYIGRFKPQNIELDSMFKPFIPDYIPAVGEVDAFLKMPKPDQKEEDFGITVLDEPAMNCSDDRVLEMKYIQLKKTVNVAPQEMTVKSIDNADKNPKEIMSWINVADLHKSKPPATVNYTKQMPDFDLLMEEWPHGMEKALRDVSFPTPDIAMNTLDYSSVMLALLGIP